jgi:hypothetical protein
VFLRGFQRDATQRTVMLRRHPASPDSQEPQLDEWSGVRVTCSRGSDSLGSGTGVPLRTPAFAIKDSAFLVEVLRPRGLLVAQL